MCWRQRVLSPQPASPGTCHQPSPIQRQSVPTRELRSSFLEGSGQPATLQLISCFRKLNKLAKQSQKYRDNQNTSVQILLPGTLLPQGSLCPKVPPKRPFHNISSAALFCSVKKSHPKGQFSRRRPQRLSQGRQKPCTSGEVGNFVKLFLSVKHFLCNLAQPTRHWTTGGKITSIHMCTIGQ